MKGVSPENQSKGRFWRHHQSSLALSVLLVALVAVFGALNSASFLDYDDPLMVSGNEVVQKGITGEGIAYAFSDTTMNLWHPLTWMSHMLDWQMFGDSAGGHHQVNVFWHGANVLLVFFLLRALTGRVAVSFFVALLFAVHPMHVESVAWVSERKDVLSTFFYLATVMAYVQWTRARKLSWFLGVTALCLLGFLSKPSLITLPFVLILLDVTLLQRANLSGGFKTGLQSLGKLALEKSPFFLMAGIFGFVAWKVQAGGGHEGLSEILTFPERLAITGLAYGSYLWRTIWPVGLSPFYAHPETLSPAMVTLCWAVLIAVSAGAIMLIKRAPYVFFGWFWFVGLLFPASGIITISDNFAPDRYSYLAHVGLFVAVVWGLADLASRFKMPVLLPRIAGGAAAALLAVLCVKQTAVWKSDESLWQHAVDVTERNYFAHNKLAVEMIKAGRDDEGLKQLEASVAAKPDFAFAHANLGTLLAKHGENESAVRHFKRAIATKPDDLAMRRALVAALGKIEADGDELLNELEALVRLDTEDPRARYDLASHLLRRNRGDEALKHYRVAERLTPNSNFLVRGDLGALLVKRGAFGESIDHLEAAAAQADNPNRDRAYHLLGFACHKIGDQAAARRHLEAALKINPNLSRARAALQRIPEDGKSPSSSQSYVLKTP